MSASYNNKKNLINISNILNIIKKYNTPVWIYNENVILKKIKQLKKFDIIRFAQKSCSNINILKLMKENSLKIDAVSLGEIERALIAGFTTKQQDIIFTADMFDNNDVIYKIIKLNLPVNIGSIDMLHQLGKLSPKHSIWLRINPKFGYGHSKKTNTGGENSKHGIWDTQLALNIAKKYQLNIIGLHMHIGSGVNHMHLKKVCHAMVKEILDFKIDILSISAGGGLSIPYQCNEKHINTNYYYNAWNEARNKIANYLNHDIKLEIEPGRFLIAESGILVSQVKAIKNVGKNIFVLVNAGFNDLIRPVLYGSYHHITVIPWNNRKIDITKTIEVIIGGPLCESGDIFTQTEYGDIQKRTIPQIEIDDYIIFHDTGAYGASMSSNYNSRLLIPEILMQKNGKNRLIRRRQTFKELFQLEIF